MKKSWILIAIIAILLIAFFFIGKSIWGNKKIKENPCIEEVNSLKGKINAQIAFSDSLQKELNKCMGVYVPLTDSERLDSLTKEVEKMKAQLNSRPTTRVYNMPARTYSAPTPKRKVVAPKEDVEEKSFSENPFKIKVATTTNTPTIKYASASTEYYGQMKGSYFTTIDENGYLMYGISKSISPQAPRLNGTGGELFTSNDSYWTYTNKSRIISVAEINIETEIWTVYTGEKNYGTGSYPVFLPHETLKPLIVEARGYDYGAITPEDIQKMSQTNPLVGKSLIPNSAEGHSGTDKGFYNGWSFKTKIVAVKKTTTVNAEN